MNQNNNIQSDAIISFNNYLNDLYIATGLNKADLSMEIFKQGMVGYFNIRDNVKGVKKIITIIDYDKLSTKKRLWVIDILNKKLLYHSLVAHGKNTGEDVAFLFSNQPQSYMSSLGFFLTGHTYCGKHGLSLIIEGLDIGHNDNAGTRSIVFHGAEYVSEEFIKNNGRLGRSQGCPALPVELHQKIISSICDKTIVFISHHTINYTSKYIDINRAAKVFAKS